jgi:hypothetical protein
MPSLSASRWAVMPGLSWMSSSATSARGQQPVPDAAHLVKEFLGVTEAAGGDLLFELPHPSRQDSTGLPRYGGRAAHRATSLQGYRVTPLQLLARRCFNLHRISLIRLSRSIAAPVNCWSGLLARLALSIMAGSGWFGGTRLPGTDGAGFSKMPVVS